MKPRRLEKVIEEITSKAYHCFLCQQSHAADEWTAYMKPDTQIKDTAVSPVCILSHLAHEDRRAIVVHRLQLLEAAQGIRICYWTLDGFMSLFIADREDGRYCSSWSFDVEQRVEVTLLIISFAVVSLVGEKRPYLVELATNAVHGWDQVCVREAHMLRTDPDDLAVAFVKAKMIVHL